MTYSSRSKKIIKWAIACLLVGSLFCGIVYINKMLPVLTGYAAKNLCSAVFISNRQQSEVEASNLNFSYIKYVTNSINKKDSSVTSRFLWGNSKAIYRKGFGTCVIRGIEESQLRKIQYPTKFCPYNQDTIDWPLGNRIHRITTTVDTTKLKEIIKKLMTNDGYNGHAFAFLVLHKGVPVIESYQTQFNAKTRFLSWSMAKSFTNTLAGIMVKKGKFDIYKPADLKEWRDDERKNITINDLMQMQSGLLWNENYGNRSDVTRMLYDESDFARYTYQKPIEAPAGSKWKYSSGSVNVVNYLMRKTINNDNEYFSFAQTQLFDKIGMPDAIFEVDPSGTQVGSSYIYATARDYARFGLLYIQDGVFNGERILPEGWVKYTTTPASDSNGKYGSLFWLNKSKQYASAPEDMYSCEGHEGQRIFIIPSKEIIIVLLGHSPKPAKAMKFNELLGDILNTVK